MTEVMLFVRIPFIRVVGIRSSAGLISRMNDDDDDDDDDKENEWENVFEWGKEEEEGETGDGIVIEDDDVNASRNFELIHNLGIFWNASFSKEGEK